MPAFAAASTTSWSTVDVPQPSGALWSNLGAVSCTSSTSCVAVGTSAIPSIVGAGVNYNGWVSTLSGSVWSPSGVQAINGTDLTALDGISCASPTSCVAVGQYSSNVSGTNGPLAEILHGSTWTPAALATPPGATGLPSLTNVSCSSVASCVAIGTYTQSGIPQPFIETLSGSTWSQATLPLPGGASYAIVSGISCTSVTTCVAVGTAEPSEVGFVDVLSGTTWSPSTPPLPPGTQNDNLTSVSCSSSTSCTAVGTEDGGPHITGAYVETLIGGSWTPTALPARANFGSSALQISCESTLSCVVAGEDEVGAIAITLSGTTWSEGALTIPAGSSNFYALGVSCAPHSACTVVGYSQAGPNVQTPVVETNGIRFPSAFVGLAGTQSGHGYWVARG